MRLRTLSEAECYARCYGEHRDERVSVVPRPGHEAPREAVGEKLRERFEELLDAHGPEAEAA